MEVKLFSVAEVGETFGSPPKIQLQWKAGCGRVQSVQAEVDCRERYP